MVFIGIISNMTRPEHKVFYEQATKNILAQLKTLNLTPEKYKRATELVYKFRTAFTQEDVKKATFINSEIWDLGYDSAGFCRVASISFALAMGAYEWRLMSIDQDEWYGEMGHHWLKHIPSGKVFDITYDQFTVDGLKLPYHLGTPTAYNLSLCDETHKFAKFVGIDTMKLLTSNKSK